MPKIRKMPTQVLDGLASVPDESILETYEGRRFGQHSDFEIFKYGLDNALNILIEGPTGPGKTTAVMAFCVSEGLRFYFVPSNSGISPDQLFGKYIPNEDQEEGGPPFIWKDGGVTEVVRNGGVLLINEINFMPDRIATVIYGLLDARREVVLLDHKGERVRAHRPNCWCELDEEECKSKWVLVAGDMNPDYAGTRPLNHAFRNRFAIQLFWDYDSDVERRLVGSKELLTLATGMRMRHGIDLFTPISTNMLMEFERIAKDMGVEFAITNFVQHCAPAERTAIFTVMSAARSNLETEITPPKPVEPPDSEVRRILGDWMD